MRRPELHLNTSHDSSKERAHHVPFGQLTLTTSLQLALALIVFRFAKPDIFAAEIKQPGLIVAWMFAFGIPLSLFEYLYHRYLLHSAVLPFLKAMHRSHSHHHGLTAVKASVLAKQPEKLVPVANEYAVEEDHQEEDMMFPVYALTIFQALFAVLLGIPAKLMFPGQPAIFALIVAVTVYYSAYEYWHAVMHLPYDRFWKPLIESKRFGPVAKHVYGFHLMHHWRPTANLAVVGLWGIALWDHLFRTHHRPVRTPLVGAEVNYHDASLKGPRWPVSTMDRWQAKLYQWSRKIEATCARIFLGSGKTKS